MAITYPVDLPLTYVANANVRRINASTYRRSAFTRKITTQEYEGESWQVSVRFFGLGRSLAQPVEAFIDSLRGPIGTCVVPYPGYAVPLGAAQSNPSSPTVNGSGQAGNATLSVTSGPLSIAGWLLAGDIIQVGPSTRPHWHRVLEDVDTDGSGNATIEVWPRVRNDVIGGDPVSYSSPLCLFRLSQDVGTEIERPTRHSVELTFDEEL